MSKVAAMPIFRSESTLVRRLCGALVALFVALSVAGCSMARLGYGQLPDLSYWWIDSYLDLDDAQSVVLRNDLSALHRWHRQHELLPLAHTLAHLQSLAPKDTTPAAVCQVVDELQLRVQTLADQAAPSLARLAVNLKPAQLAHLQHQLTKRQQTWAKDWLADAPAERLEKRSQRLIDRSEMFYGRLDDAQRAALRARVHASGFNPTLMQRDLLERHQVLLQTVQNLARAERSAQAAEADTRQLLTRLLHSPDEAKRQHADLLKLENCQTFAALHNSASLAQKQKLAETLRAYELDARALAGAQSSQR